MAQISGQTYEYKSVDVLNGCPEDLALQAIQLNGADASMENINKQTPTGLPPHVLKLKIGTKVMLIRNLSVKDGLCNGTVLQIIKCTDTLIHCRMRTKQGFKTVLIPKVKFEHGHEKDYRGTKFTRIQFPLRVAFASTINKSQGQTLRRVGLALDKQQCFAHGHLYVAFSRVRRQEDIRIITSSSAIKDAALNIVEKDLIT